jgi:hypothetical protein
LEEILHRRFIDTFPENEIAVLIENSTVGLFSFAIIDHGEKIRMKACEQPGVSKKGLFL